MMNATAWPTDHVNQSSSLWGGDSPAVGPSADDHGGDTANDGVFVPSETFVKSYERRMVEIVIDLSMSFIVCLLGIATNIMTIAVFYRQGFQESVSVSMTCISLWDLVKSLSGALQRLSGPVSLMDDALAKSWTNFGIVVFTYIITFSSYVSSVLAAYVALERCLCVSIPFTVKVLLTPKFTFIVCLGISIVVFGSFVVVWGIYDFSLAFDPTLNVTILTYVNNDFYYTHGDPLFTYYNISGIAWPLVSFLVIVVCTVIIAYHLKRSAQIRVGMKEDTANRLSSRDRQVIKMLLVIIIIYAVTLSPRVSLYFAKYFIPDFYFLRKYHNVFLVSCYVLLVFDLSNGAVNMLVFVVMSSSFRTTFLEMFRSCWHRKKDTSK